MNIEIVIPVYNPGTFLEASLDSCLSQDYKGSYQITLIDDASTQDLSSIIDRFKKDPRLKQKGVALQHYALKQNRGVAFARNVALRKTNADVLLFQDADDVMLEKRLSHTVRAFENDPKIQMVCGNFRWSYQGKITDVCFATPPEIFYATMLIHCPVHTSTAAIRRSVLAVTGLFNENYPVLEDYDLWIRIAKHFPEGIHYIHEELAIYNWCATEASLSKKYRKTKEAEAILHEISQKYGTL